MLHKTKGIVLNYIKHKETSVIARIYTESFGMQSYIINGVRSSRSKKGLALLQPLTLLDLVVYFKENKLDGINRVSEFRPFYNFSSIPFEVKKSTVALFITELLYKTLRQEENHGAVFGFLEQVIIKLDAQNEDFESLHLYLMIQLTHYIGFGIHSEQQLVTDGDVLDNTDELHQEILRLNACAIEDKMEMTNTNRRAMLQYMCRYYARHLEGFVQMNSVSVLTQIFR